MPAASRNRVVYFLIAPAVLILALTSLYPAVYSFVLSFFNWNWGNRFDFIGLANYIDLFSSAEFWQVLVQTFLFAVAATSLELVLGIGLAVVVDRLQFGAGVIRTLLLTPLMVSGIIVALMSKIVLDPMLGIVNYALGLLGLPPSPFFGATSTAMATVIMVDAWWQTAFVFIIVLAGLQSLPQEPIEAARVDGAGSLQTFFRVKLPMLRPVLFTVLIFRTIDTLKVFDIIFGTTGGGPQIATEVMQTMAYRKAFSFLQMSEAMTVMVIFSVIVLAISLVYMRLEERMEAD